MNFLNHTGRRGLLVSILVGAAVLLSACSTAAQSSGSYAQVPAGKAYAEGKEIYFTHTEASDQAIADKLTAMMKSPVLYVPALAEVPQASRAQVYVFENGITGKGPLGFQADVFNSPPGSDSYSPLREIILVKWAEGAQAVELKSEADILASQTAGQLSTSPAGVVVNMPFIVWDGGKR
jgi:hypothetical protein